MFYLISDDFSIFKVTHLSQFKIKILVDSSPGKNRVILPSPGNQSKWVLSLPGKHKAIPLSPGKNKVFSLFLGKTNSKGKLIPLSPAKVSEMFNKALWVSEKWRLHTSAIVSGKKMNISSARRKSPNVLSQNSLFLFVKIKITFLRIFNKIILQP